MDLILPNRGAVQTENGGLVEAAAREVAARPRPRLNRARILIFGVPALATR
jgi:hypothetical protein